MFVVVCDRYVYTGFTTRDTAEAWARMHLFGREYWIGTGVTYVPVAQGE